MMRVALLATPWPLFNRPSIALACLKAFVRHALPRVSVDAHHCYLNIALALGYERYGPISESTWLAEAPYAALLYPDLRVETERFWKRRVRGTALGKGMSFQALCRLLRESSREFLDKTDWRRRDVVGFSVCYGQLTSSLYFARDIKRRSPSTQIVFGGSACAGEMGTTLLGVFPDVDVVVCGEGEKPLVHLIRSLQDGDDPIPPFPGLLTRHAEVPGTEGVQVTHLDDLPIPDFADYFSELASFPPEKSFLPRIPMEISRGCWWRKRGGSSRTSGCAFCNLNLQWDGYRFKSPDRVVREVDSLSKTYQNLSISFMDNLLPHKGLEDLFHRIKGLRKDFRFFSEIRATTSKSVLTAMGAAGMRQVQVGIEALSSRLLKKLNKGTTAMDNLEVMKHCEFRERPDLVGNLITEFPSSDERDVAETLKTIDFALPFNPLKDIPFWLGYGSAVWASPRAYGIRRVGNHPLYRYLFPREIRRRLTLMIQGYQGGVGLQRRLWSPVRRRMAEWRRAYAELHRNPGFDPILSYSDGVDFMIIRQWRHDRHAMTHRLVGTSRKIYLFCDTQRDVRDILLRFPGFGEEKVVPFLTMMVDKHLMFNEGDRYLSLAVPGPQEDHSF